MRGPAPPPTTKLTLTADISYECPASGFDDFKRYLKLLGQGTFQLPLTALTDNFV